ncbi:hypothetical protein CRYUN_Cryun25bG0043900 [Craigia yunnanensis]
MQLNDPGNLVLFHQGNVSLWEIFDYPTNTLVMGLILPVGIDFSVGDYELLLTSVDAILQWNGMTYWQLSMNNRAFKESNAPVSSMVVNGDGLYWLGDDSSRVVFQGFFLLIALVIVGFLWRRRRKWHFRTVVVRLGSKKLSLAEIDIISIPGLPMQFEYEELATATDNFKTQIGNGGFDTMYKDILANESVLAVKKITNLGVEGNDFCTKIHHINLVKLKGYCVQRKQRFLVFEYMKRGSLDSAIFNDESVVEWKEILEITLGTAQGLTYLHDRCQHKIIHCDVKPENLLLHDNLQMKISDFGISKLLTSEQSNLFTTLRVTRGYLAPEWLTSSGILDKSDVYSYEMFYLKL